MAEYIVHKTDTDTPSVTVPAMRVNDTDLDVSLFGSIRLEYGEALDEDLLNILENFSCPEEPGLTGNPALSQTSKTQLANPTIGQFWYNSSRGVMFFWNGTAWDMIPLRESYAANWGIVVHGQALPRPVSPINGYTFRYDECIWSVAPSALLGKIGSMSCYTDEDAVVTMQYRFSNTETIIDGLANYLIIGISGNTTRGPFLTPPAPSPTIAATPTPTVTPTITVTPGVSATPAVSATATPGVSATPTPTASVTPTPGVSATPTPTVTPTATVTPTVTAAPTVTPTVTPSSTPTAVISVGGTYSNTNLLVDPEPISCFVTFQSDGNIATNDDGAGPDPSMDWFLPNAVGVGNDYELFASEAYWIPGATGVKFGTLGSWQPMSSSVFYSVEIAGIEDSAQWGLNVQIRDANTLAVVATGVLEIIAENAP